MVDGDVVVLGASDSHLTAVGEREYLDPLIGGDKKSKIFLGFKMLAKSIPPRFSFFDVSPFDWFSSLHCSGGTFPDSIRRIGYYNLLWEQRAILLFLGQFFAFSVNRF